MLKITDAERSTVVEIPIQLAESIGVFQDMIETAQGSEPAVLDEGPELFNQLVCWLFHLPNFQVTEDNVEDLLEMSQKYEIPSLAKDVSCQVLIPTALISPERAYFLGAAYGAPILETMYRQYVVSNFATLLTGPDSDPKAESHFNLLNRRYPEKVFGLVKDAVLAAEERVSQRESALKDCKAAIFSIQRGSRDNVLKVDESFLKRAKGKIAEIEEEIKSSCKF